MSALLWLAALTLGSYALIRPAVEASFLRQLGLAALPKVWVVLGLATPVALALFLAVARKLSPRLAWVVLCAVSALLLPTLGFLSESHTWANYALYATKDLYIVCMVEMLWLLAHARTRRAGQPRRTATLFARLLIFGELGGLTGGLVSAQLGTLSLGLQFALAAVPLLGAAALGYGLGYGLERDAGDLPSEAKRRLMPEGAVRISWLGLSMLSFALCTQIAFVGIDFAFNAALASVQGDGARTQALFAYSYAAIQGCSIALLLGAGATVRPWGRRLSLGLGPALGALGLVIGALFALPWTAALAKISTKALDYSWQRIAREQLFLRLPDAERVLVKGLGDVWLYRSAKAAGALVLLLATWLWPTWVLRISVATVVLWALSAAWLLGQVERVARPEGEPSTPPLASQDELPRAA